MSDQDAQVAQRLAEEIIQTYCESVIGSDAVIVRDVRGLLQSITEMASTAHANGVEQGAESTAEYIALLETEVAKIKTGRCVNCDVPLPRLHCCACEGCDRCMEQGAESERERAAMIAESHHEKHRGDASGLIHNGQCHQAIAAEIRKGSND